MSRQNTPRRKPVPKAFEQASLSANRFAYEAAVCTRRWERSCSISVNTRSLKRAPNRSQRLFDPPDVNHVVANTQNHANYRFGFAHNVLAGCPFQSAYMGLQSTPSVNGEHEVTA